MCMSTKHLDIANTWGLLMDAEAYGIYKVAHVDVKQRLYRARTRYHRQARLCSAVR